jgi:hypothetical protein
MVGSFLITDAQSPKLIQPSERPLDDPPPSAQSAAMFCVALGEPRHDVAGTQTLPDCRHVITTVSQHAIRTMARSSSLALQGWDGINQCEGLLRVVAIGPGELNGQWNSAFVTDQMTLAAELRSVGRIRSRFEAPKNRSH